MKKIALILLVVVMMALAACAGANEPAKTNSSSSSQGNTSQSSTSDASRNPSGAENEDKQSNETPDTSSTGSEHSSGSGSSKILVAYFSATNNTESVAQKLADGLGADIYEIVPEQLYTDEDIDYGDSGSRTSLEMDDPASRPEISGSVENMEQYDVVFIGYPIWWGEAPRIMSTFVESYDFSGKTLVAFCTSGSSGFGSSDSALRDAAYTSTWLEGHRFSAGASSEEVLTWASGLEIQ